MTNKNVPHFIIKKNLQKSNITGVFFSDLITPDVLLDVCIKITGCSNFTYKYVDNDYSDNFLEKSYNKGRLAIMHYKKEVYYITFSEKEIGGRNSSIQSVPTAFNLYYLNPYPRKHLMYYFLNNEGNHETNYHILMYRLMKTIGFNFINAKSSLNQEIKKFTSIEDIMFNRKMNSIKNKSNNSTYITKSTINNIEVYGKTYGASKYETSMICYALSFLKNKQQKLTLYEVLEGDLKELPSSSLNVLNVMGNINIVPTDIQLERKLFEENNSLRSPRFIYNLFNKFGKKKCMLCNCEIPELIQGAHIWPVSYIKKEAGITLEERIKCATDGENGLWLCENHHKLFDSNIISINEKNGKIEFKNKLNKLDYNFLNSITILKQLPSEIMTDTFTNYLLRRNQIIN